MVDQTPKVGTPPVGQSCGGCKFMIQRGTDPNFYYECHYNPPAGIPSTWPQILATDWCGVWQAFV